MKVHIIPYDPKYLDELAREFIAAYQEPEHLWSHETAKAYLGLSTVDPTYCFVAVDDSGNCLGGVFARNHPYFTSSILYIDSLHVKDVHRQKGVGKELMKKVIITARTNGINHVWFLVDVRKEFPQAWYKKMGFKLSNWAAFEADIDKLTLT